MNRPKNKQFREEKDSLGMRQVAKDVYWGIHTQRALDNFPFSSGRLPVLFIRSLALVKKASTAVNMNLNYLDSKKGQAIVEACEEISEGKWKEHFPLSVLQGGAGTSANMNMNEVIANRALEIMGLEKGRYDILNPIEDVNKHQSTNDVFPTAIKVSSIFAVRDLSQQIEKLQNVFQKKEKEFSLILKIGRTELQEAVPITLGSEFSAFAEAFSRDRWRTFKCEERLRVVNLGGTALGTGLGAPRKYIFQVIEELRKLTGLGLSRAENILGDTAHVDCFVEVSGILKAHATNLIKVCNDLRVLSMLKEIELPKVQTGSSIMPGKINPVICESTVQVGMKVIANDSMITDVAKGGSLQINEFLPLLMSALLESIELLTQANQMLCPCVAEIKANERQCAYYLNRSRSIITAFVPHIGYRKCEEFLTEFAAQESDDIRGFLMTKLGPEMVNKVLSPENVMSLGFKEKKEK